MERTIKLVKKGEVERMYEQNVLLEIKLDEQREKLMLVFPEELLYALLEPVRREDGDILVNNYYTVMEYIKNLEKYGTNEKDRLGLDLTMLARRIETGYVNWLVNMLIEFPSGRKNEYVWRQLGFSDNRVRELYKQAAIVAFGEDVKENEDLLRYIRGLKSQ